MMKPLNILFAAAVAGLVLGSATLGSGAHKSATAAQPYMFLDAQSSSQYMAKTRLIGVNVLDGKNNVVGDIEDLIVSEENRIIGVVLGIGGALGFGEKKIGVRMSALTFTFGKDKEKDTIRIAFPVEALKEAPEYKRLHSDKSLIERAAETAKTITSSTATATKNVLKKAAEKTSETVAKAKEATKKVVAPAEGEGEGAKPKH